jgi:hypothetical protein
MQCYIDYQSSQSVRRAVSGDGPRVVCNHL